MNTIVLNAAGFAAALQRVSPLCNGRVIPIRGFVLMRVDSSDSATVSLHAVSPTNICASAEVAGVVSVDCSEQRAELLLPPNRVLSIIRETSCDCLTLRWESSRIEVRTDHSRFVLSSEDASAFPRSEPASPEVRISLPARLLTRALQHCSAAADRSANSRYALSAIVVDWNNPQQIKIVATDSRQMVVRDLNPRIHLIPESSPGYQQERLCKIPLEAVRVINGILDSDQDAHCEFSSSAWSIVCGGNKTHGPCAEGRFPKWTSVIGKTEMICSVSPKEMARACRLAAVVTTNETIGVDVSFSENQLSIASATADVADANVNVICSTMPIASGRVVKLDIQKLRSMFEFVPDGEVVEWRGAVEGNAQHIVAPGSLHLLMPMELE